MCGSNCVSVGPPPDSILSMPPPPLPTFLLPRSAIVALSGNDSQPCFAAFMCEPAPGPREQAGGLDYVEMSGKGNKLCIYESMSKISKLILQLWTIRGYSC